MKKTVLMVMGLLSYFASYAYMRPADPYNMYDGPEVKEERAQGSAYVPPQREFINSRYGEYLENRPSEFRPGQESERLFWSYSQP